MRRISLIFLALILAMCAQAGTTKTKSSKSKPAAKKDAGTMVQFASASSTTGQAQGYLVLPSSVGKQPAIIVIHEWWGLDPWVKQQAERFAKQGYVTLAVDLYRGKVAKTPDDAHELMRGMPEDRAIADLHGAFDYLSNRKDVDPKHIGVIGWCMGGGYSLALATREPRLAACVVNYGRLVTSIDTIRGIRAPVLGNFGAEDQGIPPADVRAFETAMKQASRRVDIKIYEGAAHAFMNPNNNRGYAKAAAEDAWARIDHFFATTLRGTIPNS